MKEVMSHEQIKAAFNEIYNSFYLQNRCPTERMRTDAEWEKMIQDAEDICKNYDTVMVRKIVGAVLDEFEREETKKQDGKNDRNNRCDNNSV